MPTYAERTAGIYRAKYVGCQSKTFTDPDTGEQDERWIWRFQEVNDPLSTGEISKITGTSLQSANSNAHKLASGIVGRKLQPGDDTEDYVGQIYDVVYGPNQVGNLTITSVVRVAPEAAAAPAAEPAPAVPASQEPLPEMP